MCFSAAASFVAAGVTGVIGIGCLAKTRTARDLPLALMPLLFAAQQTVEGLLWLELPVAPDAARATLLTKMFLLFAKAFWPAYVPLTVLLVEPDERRRGVMQAIAAGGIVVGLYFLRDVAAVDHPAAIIGGHIAYDAHPNLPWTIAALYILTTCAAPLLSSHAAIRVLAVIVAIGATITYVAYWHAFTSVWCFFAAAASVVLLRYFVRQKRFATVASRA